VREERAGIYCCRGCDLTLYESRYKVVLANYVFFYNAVPDSMLMGIDTVNPYGAGEAAEPGEHLIEVHCRRCGSHLGHVLKVLDKALHCINGASLDFRPDEA
jgi:peptide-methionine (R)-S-oxide reductase